MSALALDPEQDAARISARLMARAAGVGNDQAFASMIATAAVGGGALPPWLGLDPAAFRCLLEHHFPGTTAHGLFDWVGGTRIADERVDEWNDLLRLLLMHKAGDSPSEVWMAHVVATGCLANNHLWQDLGLWDRGELTALMRRNFPSLAVRNVHDMKWKRFLYKQLCEAEGIYTCRAPSCEVCTDYYACFGPES
ncbi:hydrogenase [Thiocapsa imhoffii]|uniref:Hydrogenase n=1 Tax=Thiocapsa imhoffii TaxID=382777 RepID=A0A9X0WJ63_9GAMM|nr:nitrogen fixation protein NifQ [Thiocapsa imhoffii]MBK1645521.1 hydrogenase [Thiocapsa imhoffii]